MGVTLSFKKTRERRDADEVDRSKEQWDEDVTSSALFDGSLSNVGDGHLSPGPFSTLSRRNCKPAEPKIH